MKNLDNIDAAMGSAPIAEKEKIISKKKQKKKARPVYVDPDLLEKVDTRYSEISFSSLVAIALKEKLERDS